MEEGERENNRAQLQYARGGDRVDNHSEMRSPACKMHRELGRGARERCTRGEIFYSDASRVIIPA